MILTEKERKETMNFLTWMIWTIIILFILGLWFAFAHVIENEKANIPDPHTTKQGLNMDRIWLIQIEDDNIALLISKGDTIILSLENTYGLTNINPVVFTNIY
jgi:hypothetical protein